MAGSRKVNDHPGRGREAITVWYGDGLWWAQCGHGVSRSTVSRDAAIKARKAADKAHTGGVSDA